MILKSHQKIDNKKRKKRKGREGGKGNLLKLAIAVDSFSGNNKALEMWRKEAGGEREKKGGKQVGGRCGGQIQKRRHSTRRVHPRASTFRATTKTSTPPSQYASGLCAQVRGGAENVEEN
uniref:Uncharacterized protein n=1 Tax=Trypanosoma congolense (strain IL3000) TaxID=1068625 RepID=G0UR87_TRYCI|nr:hypothetical protein, unlikely [Trypanosoma congolense IL3000]